MRSFSVILQVEMAARQTETFEHIVPIDLSSIFTGYGPLPAVKGTQNQMGAWDAVGQSRTVLFADESSAQEQLTAYQHPHYFSYTVCNFSGVLRFLTTAAHGEWRFQSNSSQDFTQVKWHYALTPRSIFAAPILWLMVNVWWRGYMHQALMLCKQQIEHNTA